MTSEPRRSNSGRLFIAMCREDDDEKRAELRRQYVELLRSDARERIAHAYRLSPSAPVM